MAFSGKPDDDRGKYLVCTTYSLQGEHMLFHKQKKYILTCFFPLVRNYIPFFTKQAQLMSFHQRLVREEGEQREKVRHKENVTNDTIIKYYYYREHGGKHIT